MIIRKPYAFLIRKFKLIHAIILFLTIYITYKTCVLVSFFNTYVTTTYNIIGNDLVSKMFNSLVFLAPFFVIIISIILLIVLLIKKKPYIFYLFNIAVYIYMLVVFNIGQNIISNMEVSLVDVRLIRMMRDLCSFGIIVEIISLIFLLVRTTGFDVKKFNFAQDIKEMKIEIDESDNEEFELTVSFDVNRVKRNVNKKLREFKYVYIENRFIINVFIFLFISLISGYIYLNNSVYNRYVKQGTYFSAGSLNMKATNVFITDKDYKGNKIKDNYSFVLVELDLKSLSQLGKKLSIADLSLFINEHHFYHNETYKEAFFDFGKIYNDELIENKYQKKVLIFEIPSSYVSKKMQLKHVEAYTEKGKMLLPKYLTVNLDVKELGQKEEKSILNLKDTIDFSNSVLKKTNITFSSFEMAKKFKVEYNFKVSNNETLLSTDYIRPSLNSNIDKALIKLIGKMEMDNELNIGSIYNLYDFIKYFGTIHYEINGVLKIQNIGMKQIVSSRVKQDNVIYLEIFNEVLNAEKISLVFKIRDQKYEYVLK